MKMHRHHLLEIILWPNEDGTFRQIINDCRRLKELGIYNDYKLTILIDAKTHSRLHAAFPSATRTLAWQKCTAAMRKSNINREYTAETRKKISASRIGIKFSDNHKRNLSESHKGKKRIFSDEHKKHLAESQKGRKFSAEHKAKLSDAKKGMHWFNNGIKTIRSKECPAGYVPGRLKLLNN